MLCDQGLKMQRVCPCQRSSGSSGEQEESNLVPASRGVLSLLVRKIQAGAPKNRDAKVARLHLWLMRTLFDLYPRCLW